MHTTLQETVLSAYWLWCGYFTHILSLVGDGRLGYPKAAPYDAIHVGAAAEKVPQAVSCL